ncbi:AAA family ATPase [Nonomuraea sp. NPDC046570]|uniref:ATP-binding protein n=1 Tax=Nonomuraea sp. NPDC046570 TaxID=3155255 RepID=UPI0033FB54EF
MFVGRQAELAALAAAHAGAREAARAVLVTGEAGIGKSRLVAEFTGRLVGTLVVEGAADPGAPPYAPFVGVLRRLVRAAGADVLPSGGRRGLARLLPELGEVEAVPDLGRARLYEEILVLVERAAPLVMVLEDLHWSDPCSRELLVFLLRNVQRPGVLVVATAREARGLWPLLRLPNLQVIAPPPLGRAEIAAQLGGLLGREPAKDTLDHVVRRSEGNPLFVEALAGAGGGTSAALRELLLAEATRLPPPSRDVLKYAAVAGPRPDHDLLRRLARLDDQALDDALRPVVAARLLVVRDDGYAFRHTLIREAIYDELPPGERIRLHRRCAEELADRPEPATDHWQEAGELGAAFDAAWRARRYERVLELWDAVQRPAARAGADRARVYELAAETALRTGSAGRAEDLVSRALAALDARAAPERAAHLLELRVAVRDQLGEDGLDDLREAVRLAPSSPRLAALADTLAWNGRDADARAHARQALTADPPVRARALVTLATLEARAGDLESATDLYIEASHTARNAGGPVRCAVAGDAWCDEVLLAAAASEADVLEAAGEHERAVTVARRGIAEARRMGLARSRGTLLAAHLAGPLASLGRWPEAREVVGGALALEPPPINRAWLLLVSGGVAVGEGDLEAATEALDAARPLMARGRSRGEDACLEPDLLDARIALAGGDLDRAARLTDHALAAHDLSRSRRHAWPLLALAARVHRVRHASLDGLRVVATTLATTGRLQQAHRATFEAECGGSWPAAVAAWRAVGQPYPLAQALLRDAETHPPLCRSRSGETLREAAAIAADLGAALLLREAERLAVSARVELVPDPRLTPRELDVLRLLADGLSNRQIAERLYISARTSGVHVTHVMAKLEASSRIEAATLARRLRLI